jgi:hypothetical protein
VPTDSFASAHVAVLQLVESGRIGLDDRVERYLGLLQPYRLAVTIRQATTGLGNLQKFTFRTTAQRASGR